MLEQMARAYDLVVVDSAPLLAVPETAQLVPLIDAVVFCVRMGQTTVDQVNSGGEALSRLPERLTALAVTELVERDAAGYGYQYAYAYAYRRAEHEDETEEPAPEIPSASGQDST